MYTDETVCFSMQQSLTAKGRREAETGSVERVSWISSQPSTGSTGVHKILVVDDNSISRELVREALEGRRYLVVEASDGREALERMMENPPDLVLMDIQMPVMDGYAALQRIRQDPRFSGMRVVALTAYAMLGDREKALAAGFDGYIAKPVNVHALRAQIDQILR